MAMLTSAAGRVRLLLLFLCLPWFGGCSLLVEGRLSGEREPDGGGDDGALPPSDAGADSGFDASGAACSVFPESPFQSEACWRCECGNCPALADCLKDPGCSAALECVDPPALGASYAVGNHVSCGEVWSQATRDSEVAGCFMTVGATPRVQSLAESAWVCACEQHQVQPAACGEPGSCGEPYCVPDASGGGVASDDPLLACCTNGMDDDGDGTSDCGDPSCLQASPACHCQALFMEAGFSAPPTPPERQACACSKCMEFFTRCLAGADGMEETGDDLPLDWCLAAALCRSSTHTGGRASLPWGCGESASGGPPQPGVFSPMACPDSQLQRVAGELERAFEAGNHEARWLFTRPGRRLPSPDAVLAGCLCRQAVGNSCR